MQSNPDTIDGAVMGVGSGLILLGVVVVGVVELLNGQPYGAAPVTNEAGELVATPMVDPSLRTGLVVAGLTILVLWCLYRYATILMDGADGEAVRTAAY